MAKNKAQATKMKKIMNRKKVLEGQGKRQPLKQAWADYKAGKL